MKQILFILLLLSVNGISAQSFPESWVGNYSGDLEIFSVDSISRTITMGLDIQPTEHDSIFKWQISYQLDTVADIRKYEIHILDKAKGLYKIDEKNGIIIEAYMKNNVLTSFFSVMTNFVIATYLKVEDHLEFEIIMAKTEAVSTTGEIEHEGEDIPKVETFPIWGRQKAILYKK